MALRPVSTICDVMATPRQRRWIVVHGAPLHVGQRCFTIDRVTEHVEHTRQDALAYGCLQGSAGVLNGHPPREPLRGRQGNPAHVMCIALGQYFDDDIAVRARAQQ